VPNYSICEAQQQGLKGDLVGHAHRGHAHRGHARAAISGWEVPRERCRGIPRDALAPGVALRLAGLVCRPWRHTVADHRAEPERYQTPSVEGLRIGEKRTRSIFVCNVSLD
jgi:hypothetical protein